MPSPGVVAAVIAVGGVAAVSAAFVIFRLTAPAVITFLGECLEEIEDGLPHDREETV